MRITLNSRTLVGPQHAAAAAFASEWPPGLPVEVEWVESPSARCVLAVELPPDQPVILEGNVEAVDGHDASNHLEKELREHLDFPPLRGDDADGSERQPLTP